MSQLPNQLSAFYRAYRLPVIQPLNHPLCVSRGARCSIIGLARSRFDEEVSISLRLRWPRPNSGSITGRYYVIIRLVQPHMSWLHKSCLYIESVDFVEHGFYESFNGILGCAIRAEAWYAERAGCGGEDEIAAAVLGAEMGEGELNDMEGT